MLENPYLSPKYDNIIDSFDKKTVSQYLLDISVISRHIFHYY